MHLSHLLRTDFRQYRLVLVVWIVAQAMTTASVGMQFLDTGSRNAGVLPFLGFVLTLGTWLGIAVLVPLIMHAHPAVGSNAFWLTRPIPWRTMVASKTVLLGTIFVALPVLFEAILMAVFRVSLRKIVLVSVQSTLTQWFVIATLMALAALTRNLAGFGLLIGAVLIALALLLNITLVIMMRTLGSEPPMYDVSLRGVSTPTGDLFFMLALTAAFALIVAVQYRLRSTRTTISTGALAIAVVIGLAFAWPSSESILAAPAWASSVQIIAREPKIEFTAHEWALADLRNPWVNGGVRMSASGIERSWLGTLRLVESNLQFEDGSKLSTSANGNSTILSGLGVLARADFVAARDLLGVTDLGPEHRAFAADAELALAITLRERDFRKYAGQSAAYHGRFVVDFDQLQIAGTLPLQRGAEFGDGTNRFVFMGVIRNGSAAQVQVRRVAATTMFDSDAGDTLSFYLRNARLSQGVIGGHSYPVYAEAVNIGVLALVGIGSVSTSTDGFKVTSERIDFSAEASGQPGVTFTDEWLADAELVAVRRVARGSVMRTIDIPRAQLVEGTRPTTR